jgi:DNA-binding XRE family transcriptional regulator
MVLNYIAQRGALGNPDADQLSTRRVRFYTLPPLFGFSSGRYHDGMSIQHTPRASRQSPRFPNKIREYRLKAGLSQRTLADMLGRGRNAVSSWERGLTLPSVPRLLKMAKILGTLAESLYMEFYTTFPNSGESFNAASA